MACAYCLVNFMDIHLWEGRGTSTEYGVHEKVPGLRQADPATDVCRRQQKNPAIYNNTQGFVLRE